MSDPAGCISLAQENLRNTLADCASFRTWVGASGANAQTQARNRIYAEELPPPNNGREYTLAELQGYRPYVLVWTDTQNGFTKTKDAVGCFRDAGKLKLRFFQDVPEPIQNNSAEVDRRFKNLIGTIMQELCDLAETAGYLSFDKITLEEGPYRSDAKDWPKNGDWQGIDLSIEWQG